MAHEISYRVEVEDSVGWLNWWPSPGQKECTELDVAKDAKRESKIDYPHRNFRIVKVTHKEVVLP